MEELKTKITADNAAAFLRELAESFAGSDVTRVDEDTALYRVADVIDGLRPIENSETAEMRDLALRYVDDLEAESLFDPSDAALCARCDGSKADHPTDWNGGKCLIYKRRKVPDDIWEYVDEDEYADDPETALNDALEAWRERATDNVLDIRGSVSFNYGGDGITLDTLTVVLGTGGPHVEVEFNEDGRGTVIAYGWFGAHRAEIPVQFPGHPIAALFGLYAGMVDGTGY